MKRKFLEKVSTAANPIKNIVQILIKKNKGTSQRNRVKTVSLQKNIDRGKDTKTKNSLKYDRRLFFRLSIKNFISKDVEAFNYASI